MTTRTTTATPAEIARARKRLEHLEDPDEQAWQGAARARLEEYDGERAAWEAAMSKARNRAERRAVGPPPRFDLPRLPDFAEKASPAAKATGELFGRFLVHPDTEDQTAGTIHDVQTATEACDIGRTPRTFVHFRDEVAAAFPNAEPCPSCAARTAGQA